MNIQNIEATIARLKNLSVHDFTITHIHNMLCQLGWQVLSEDGVFSTVLLSPCKKGVIRLGADQDGLLLDNYPLHVQNCLNHPENPFFQNIYWHTLHPEYERNHPVKSLNITLMEKLEPLDASNPMLIEEYFIKDMLKNFYEYVDGTSYLTFLPFVPSFHLTQALNAIRQVEESHERVLYDISNDNLMLRAGNQLVITDPLQ